ncbi:hypothetical protein [Arthrobacter sp. H35-D1]|uniref:hypothetical protein n=1 Tax=Arthrobacter sp. H35-D1 TaxID=3046202 RepID=UPI0024BA5ED3|nr:hypothetical protein [Arthrobacter sp. H35-D1]MDJ0314593.1 hypothetical protein [Arthrobacter sp. H35-D1]
MEQSAFQNHSLWETLAAVSRVLSEIDGLADVAVSSSLEEIRHLRAHSEALVETDQTFLIGQSAVDSLDSAWGQVNTSLNNYLQSPASHLQHLENAKGGYLDSVRSALTQFPRAEEAGAKKAASTRAASAYVEQVETARVLLDKQIEELRAEQERMTLVHAEDLERFRSSVQEAEEHLERLTTRIGEGESRLSTALTETNDAFIKAQTDRQDRFGKWLEQQEQELLEQAKPHLDSIIDADDKAEAALEKVESLRTSVVGMSNLAAGDILGDQYKKSARWDRIAGYVGYGVGILAGIAGVYLILFAFGNIETGLSWPQVALKLGMTAGIGGIATVAFRFGGHSLFRATAFKRQELELRAMTPFLQDVEGADDAKLAFVKQAFGRAWIAEQKSEDASQDSTAQADLVKLLQTAIEAFSKAGKV